MESLFMKFEMPIVETWLGYLLVPAFLFWLITWKPNPSRWILAFRLVVSWAIAARLAIHDSVYVSGEWQQELVWVLGGIAAICIGIYLTMHAFHLHRADPTPSNNIDPNSPGRPS